MSLARNIAGFLTGYVLCPSKQYRADNAALEKHGLITRSPNDKDKRTCKLYPTNRALSVIDEVQAVCEKTESILLWDISEAEQKLLMKLLMQAGKNITAELHIERKGEEFND